MAYPRRCAPLCRSITLVTRSTTSSRRLRACARCCSESGKSLMDTVVEDARLKFRDAGVADVSAIVALVESAYRGDASRAGWTTEADFLDGQRVDAIGVGEIIVKSGSRVLLGERDRRLLACCHLEKQGDACYFGMFSVLPTLQGGGVGKQMLTEGERLARAEWKCTKMEMTVISIRNE